MSSDDYFNLFEKQNNKCAICGIEFKTINEGCVDHCHNTNIIRGILCNKCNLLLGMANDNIKILENAIFYLKTFGY